MYNIVIGVLFIIGGLSGKMVLKGTDSSMGLALVGFLIAGWGVFQMMDAPKPGAVKRKTRGGGKPAGGGTPAAAKKKNPFRK